MGDNWQKQAFMLHLVEFSRQEGRLDNSVVFREISLPGMFPGLILCCCLINSM